MAAPPPIACAGPLSWRRCKLSPPVCTTCHCVSPRVKATVENAKTVVDLDDQFSHLRESIGDIDSAKMAFRHQPVFDIINETLVPLAPPLGDGDVDDESYSRGAGVFRNVFDEQFRLAQAAAAPTPPHRRRRTALTPDSPAATSPPASPVQQREPDPAGASPLRSPRPPPPGSPRRTRRPQPPLDRGAEQKKFYQCWRSGFYRADNDEQVGECFYVSCKNIFSKKNPANFFKATKPQ